jgi:hypothetical protein
MRLSVLVVIAFAVAVALVIQPGITSAQQATATGSLKVYAVAATTGQPMSGVMLRVIGPSERGASTGPDGTWTFASLDAGAYGVSATLPDASGQGQTTVTAGQTTNVVVALSPAATAPPGHPLVRANVTNSFMPMGMGLSPTRVSLTNTSSQPVTNVQLHITGPSGSRLADCYAGGGPGVNSCRRNPNANEALWFVGSIAPGATTGLYVADFEFGTASAGAIGQPNIVWYSWQQGTNSGSFTVSLGQQ